MPPAAPSAPPAPADVTATFCATLVDEWVRAGLQHAVVAPGSRSTPLSLALLTDGRLRTEVHVDERSASFVALGIGASTGIPAVVVCTSGTAAAEMHAAVVEAHHARVPLIVVTTDRPPELRDVAAPQTIDQTRLYGSAPRWYADPGVPDSTAAASWRPLACRVVGEATGPVPGPVHLNLPFREPLLGVAGALPPAREGDRPWWRSTRRLGLEATDLDALAAGFAGRRGVIVAGAGSCRPGAGSDADSVHRLADALGWPVLADPRSGCRTLAPLTVSHADGVLRSAAFASTTRPEVVLRLGDAAASKVQGAWLASTAAWQVAIHPHGTVADPDGVVTALLGAEVAAACDGIAERVRSTGSPANGSGTGSSWAQRWCHADAEAAAAIAGVLAAHPEATEPATARAALAAVPTGGALVVGASMPVRDVEWFGAPREGATVLSNRGANGIDGVVSTAFGVARSGRPTLGLLGDLTFLHDQNGLLGAARRGLDLTLVVVDNRGGGIFSFLPQARELPPEVFETGWGTPHDVDLPALVGAHGVEAVTPSGAEEVAGAIAESVARGGTRVVVVRTDRSANVALHDEIHRAVTAAVDASLSAAP